MAVAALALGVAGGVALLDRGAWLDEFWTLASGPPDQSWAQFWGLMAHEVHPPLHYGLAQAAQKLGLTDLGALRALNVFGVAIVLGGLWHAVRRNAIESGQACAIVAIYASSPMFLDNFAELRAYFLLYSAAIAVALMARVLMRLAARGEAWDWVSLALWALCLSVFVNLHYFATFMGGLLTLALVLIRRGRGVMAFLALSALAALPAVTLFVIQRLGAGPDIISWIETGRVDAVLVMLDQTWAAGAGNVVAFGLAVFALLIAVERGVLWRELRDQLVLLILVAVFFAVLTLANALKPIVIDRYLIAAGGCILVALALLALGPHAPRFAVVAICGFALLTQARALYTGVYDRPGWAQSAGAAAALVNACPGTRVFVMRQDDPKHMFNKAKRFGHDYYAARYGLNLEEVAVGGAAPAPGVCPNVVWFEHILIAPQSASAMAEAAGVSFIGRLDMIRAGTGVLLINSAEPAS